MNARVFQNIKRPIISETRDFAFDWLNWTNILFQTGQFHVGFPPRLNTQIFNLRHIVFQQFIFKANTIFQNLDLQLQSNFLDFKTTTTKQNTLEARNSLIFSTSRKFGLQLELMISKRQKCFKDKMLKQIKCRTWKIRGFRGRGGDWMWNLRIWSKMLAQLN